MKSTTRFIANDMVFHASLFAILTMTLCFLAVGYHSHREAERKQRAIMQDIQRGLDHCRMRADQMEEILLRVRLDVAEMQQGR